jgi:penicillin-binding protein 2
MKPGGQIGASWLEHRIRILSMLAAAGFGVLVFRLFHLQVLLGGELFRMAELNRTQVMTTRAPRGYVKDRNGEVLLDNVPRFTLFYSAESVSKEDERALESELSRLFPDQVTLIRQKLLEARRTGKMTRIVESISQPMALALLEKRVTMPGVNVISEPQRRARYGALASHLLGYTDELSAAELARLKEEGYRMGHLRGRTGVERVYDQYLRGEDGGIQFEMNVSGQHLRIVQRIPSKPGADVVLTVDYPLQRALEEALEAAPTRAGAAAVVMDPRSGAILALASRPDFDPSESIVPLLADPKLPLFNRALQGGYPPGSVFKIVTAAATLDQGAWDLQRQIFCPGSFRLGRREFGCWKVHGRLDFMGALAWSCNVYYYNLGLHLGVDALERMAKAYRLGDRTGIDLPSETNGLVPGREWKKKTSRMPWFEGDTVNFSIGQGAVSTTVLQTAVLVSAVANGGTVWEPYVVDRVTNPEGTVLYRRTPEVLQHTKISPRAAELLRKGMEGVVENGSGRGIFRNDLISGAKTGTAQNPHGEDHSWFVSYSGWPGEPASLVVAVIVEHGGYGSVSAGPVARRVINAFFPPRNS